MDVRYLILSLLFLASCMPTADVSKGKLAQTGTTGGSTTGTLPDGTVIPVSWNFLGAVSNAITINVSNLDNAYVVGTQVENYLALNENFNAANYCLVSRYNIGGVIHELRSRIVPVSYFDFNLKRVVKNFRVDFQDVTNSASICANNLRVPATNGSSYVFDPNTPAPSYRFYGADQICPQCTSMLAASTVSIYKKVQIDPVTTVLDKIPVNLVRTEALTLQVNPNYSTGGGVGTCSNNQCRAQGMDCCLENQCVRDGQTKPAAHTPQYSSIFQVAEQEKIQNPLAYLNYPQLYYICGSTVPTAGGSGGGTTSGSTGGTTNGSGNGYDAGFELLKKDYACIEHLKSQSTYSPFHEEVLTTSYTGTANCLTEASQSAQEMYFQKVLKRLYTTCGCNRTELQDMITNCPNYEYTVVSGTQENPTQIDCYTPPVNTPAPTEQTVSMSSRSAPHRFFNASGVEKATPDSAQEGLEFKYLDEGKILPVQQDLSMNAILGQMTATLDQALPAKTVNVELDQVYFLSTTSGYYSPCPTCAKDSWINSFTAFPSSSMGTGLQAIGHTTQRDVFSTNTTSGNYEDTIFGRACWLPPTMIPYSHTSKSTVQSQRLDRLQTQAALFANGYQRDWFGFNKGALIGSFDGVTWFAIGKGRIVRSTSKKLFLAINAPFADVASPTMHVVRVQAYDGITQAAQVDYDPQYHQYHPFQNEAGNCQKYHMCQTDTDCVTSLGWEYSCADVKDLKSNLPEFDSNGNEIANSSKSVSLDQILHQKRFPSSSTKRCVYRGAGALCHTNVASLPAADLNKRKVLTCAPNFYCANPLSAAHNTKIARYASRLDEIPVANNHLFGKDANILGRPLNYMGSSSLGSTIHTTLAQNFIPFEATTASNIGVCQPGKALPTASNEATMSNPFNQHMSADGSKRSDFINQIGTCNTTLYSPNRHSSCPVIGQDGNYEIFSSGTLPFLYSHRASAQNACGLETVHNNTPLTGSADSIQEASPFKAIEAKPLSSLIITNPTMVRDACLRRAGAVCHTDLDCSPNKFHASQVDYFAKEYFGNDAEKSYYSEYLVCGQADPQPFASNVEAFKNYDMSKNRCCREVGKDLTTFTADIPQETYVSLAKPYLPISQGLLMSAVPGTNSNVEKRYSRLATVEGLGTPDKPVLSANLNLSAGTNITTKNQWKTLSEANSDSCCGGGWIRKFSDGSTDWSRRDRLVMDVTNFQCINSRTPLLTHPEDLATSLETASTITALVNQDYGDYCKDSTDTKGACAMYEIRQSSMDVLPQSGAAYNYGTIKVNTIKPVYTSNLNPDYYFMPRTADSDPAVTIDYASTSPSARRNIQIKLPSYIPRTLTPPTVYMENADGAFRSCGSGTVTISSPTDSLAGTGTTCVAEFNYTTRVLKVIHQTPPNGDIFQNKKVGIRFDVPARNGTTPVTRTGPGSMAYYLKRLGRLELSGIPQITFEKLTCNDNRNRIVPGIFDADVKYSVDPVNPAKSFDNSSFSFPITYTAKSDFNGTNVSVVGRFTNMHGLQHEPVFSANDFKCCSPLGKTVANSNLCCSGFGIPVAQGSTQKTCALPAGTDLMVYFNSFVSNEGRSPSSPGGGLVETDFDEQTGEPKLEATVNDKLRLLGRTYCASGKVRQGGAFGSFEVEPQGSDTTLSDRIYNIVDSTNDIGQNSNAGTTEYTGHPVFTEGFRWNHHLYCDN